MKRKVVNGMLVEQSNVVRPQKSDGFENGEFDQVEEQYEKHLRSLKKYPIIGDYSAWPPEPIEGVHYELCKCDGRIAHNCPPENAIGEQCIVARVIPQLENKNIKQDYMIDRWDARCQCGHLYSAHNKDSNYNYSAGHCTIGECRCKHFTIERGSKDVEPAPQPSVSAENKSKIEDTELFDVFGEMFRLLMRISNTTTTDVSLGLLDRARAINRKYSTNDNLKLVQSEDKNGSDSLRSEPIPQPKEETQTQDKLWEKIINEIILNWTTNDTEDPSAGLKQIFHITKINQ